MAVDRRERILILFRTRDAFLPDPVRRSEAPSGFVHGPRERDCPDCIANGRVMKSCETCGGFGVLTGSKLDAISVPDELVCDGASTDPYAREGVLPFGFTLDRHRHTRARDAEIDRLQEQIEQPKSEADAIAEANRHPYEWERERAKLRRNGDYRQLDLALDALRRVAPEAYHVLHAVDLADRVGTHVERQLGDTPDGVVQVEPSPTMRRIADFALAFIDRHMERRDEKGELIPIRVPARFLPETEAQAEQIRRRTRRSQAA